MEQMYKEDDLTEQSEEIVLRRAKNAMESAAFRLEGVELQTDRTINQTVPRNDQEQEDALKRAQMDFDKSKQERSTERQKRNLEMQRKKMELEEQKKKFREMQEERKRVVLKSDHDGFFLHGELKRGKLGAKPATLEKGDQVTGKQILGVVLDPSQLQIRVDLPEERIGVVHKGVPCEIVPKGMPDISIEGMVKSVERLPFINGKYDCVVTLRGKQPKELTPGMNCELLFTVDNEKSSKDQDGNQE